MYSVPGLYPAYTYVESQLNGCFYWDEETKGILLTTSGGVQTLLLGDAAVAKTPGGACSTPSHSFRITTRLGSL